MRAEPARSKGCSYEEFLELMRLDDAFDAGLTPAGVEQVSVARPAEIMIKGLCSSHVRAPCTFHLSAVLPGQAAEDISRREHASVEV